jgi:hypothetical protein
MKYIKKYEELKDKNQPSVGDYVIISAEPGTGITPEVKDRIGHISSMMNNTLISVYYDEGLELKHFHKNFILYLSKNREDLEFILNTKKYNL